MTKTLTKAKAQVLKERISLNQYIMIKKNLRNNVTVKNSLN